MANSSPGNYSPTDFVGNVFYAPFLNGSKDFYNNPNKNRQFLIESMYQRILTELAVNRFEWTGLPRSVNPRWLEMTLFYTALSVFYYDTEYNEYLALRATGSGRINMVGNPVSFTLLGPLFKSKTLPARQVVPIWANYLRIPDLDIITIYSHRLAELDRTIEINSKNARQNRAIVSTENQRLTMQNITRMIDEGQKDIVITDRGLIDGITPIDMAVNPDSYEKLHILRTRIWNECMGLLGINNANQDKKERLVESEIGANDDQVGAMQDVNLNARQYACEQIKLKYNLDVDVKLRRTTLNLSLMPNADEGIDNA